MQILSVFIYLAALCCKITSQLVFKSLSSLDLFWLMITGQTKLIKVSPPLHHSNPQQSTLKLVLNWSGGRVGCNMWPLICMATLSVSKLPLYQIGHLGTLDYSLRFAFNTFHIYTQKSIICLFRIWSQCTFKNNLKYIRSFLDHCWW